MINGKGPGLKAVTRNQAPGVFPMRLSKAAGVLRVLRQSSRLVGSSLSRIKKEEGIGSPYIRKDVGFRASK